LLSNKKVLLVDKKGWSGEEKTELRPTPPSPYTTSLHILSTQRDKKGCHQRYVIHIRDGYPHSLNKKTLALNKKTARISAFNAQKNALSHQNIHYIC
jgi:hypothetical protein